ncbi:hypothetical protein GIB67_026582 [Kingdonia uniflora]|uniref:Uncharacterized protein n=1 Tax=Kingdonia uniflora TaxID=39325 RepID=A0A7J7NNF7_9MAGN|nr:hypothetical protein GIB67_026582 [Kingdonia uniflora]
MKSTPPLTPIFSNHTLSPIRKRKPLQPKNKSETPDTKSPKPQSCSKQQQQQWIEISLFEESNKENYPAFTTPTKIESLDTSLAEELSVIRKRLDRLRLEKEKTEKMLRERDLVLERVMQELKKRGKEQRRVEVKVEMLQLKGATRDSPVRSLREQEGDKNFKEAELQEEANNEEKQSAEE